MSVEPSESGAWLAQLSRASRTSDCHRGTAILLSVFLGWCGMDRFYLGYFWLGLAKLFTFGGLGVWWLADFYLIVSRRLHDAEGGTLT